MKKLLFIAAAGLMLAIPASAQRGGFASANFSLNGSKGGAYIKEAGVGVDVNFMVCKNWAIGGFAGYDYLGSGEGGNKVNEITAGPIATYFLSLGKGFYYSPRIAAGFAYGNTKINYADGSAKVNSYGFLVNISPVNFEFRPAKRWGINFSFANVYFNWMSSKSDVEGSESVSTHGLSANLLRNAGLGLRYYF